MTTTREHQGLVISLIIFVALSVMLAVTTYVLYSRDETSAAKVVAAESKARDMESQAGAAGGKLNRIKRLLGFSEATPADTIEARWRRDAATYAAVYPQDEGELDYAKLHTYLAAEIRAQDDQVRQLKTSLTRCDAHIARLQRDHQGQMLSLSEHLTRLKNELVGRAKQFADQWSVYVASQNQIKQTFDASRAASDAELKRLRQQLTDTRQRLYLAERLVQTLRGDPRTVVAAEVPDGKIISTLQASGRVYLNVGRADGLRSQITFGVYPHDVDRVGGRKPKAMIQVTRLLTDPHMAEARVTQSQIADPILRGDLIFSRVWSPGSSPPANANEPKPRRPKL